MNGAVFKGFDGKGPALNLKMLSIFLPRDFKPILKDLVPKAQQKFAFSLTNPRLLDEISFWLEQSFVARLSGPTMDTMVTERDKLAVASNPFADLGVAMAEGKIIDVEITSSTDVDEFDNDDEDDEERVDLSLADSVNAVIVAMALNMTYDDFIDHMDEHSGHVEPMLNCMLSKIHEYGKFKDNLGINVADAICLLGVRLMRARMKTTDYPCSNSEMNYGKRFAVEVLERALKEAKEFKKEK